MGAALSMLYNAPVMPAAEPAMFPRGGDFVSYLSQSLVEFLGAAIDNLTWLSLACKSALPEDLWEPCVSERAGMC